MNCAEKIIRAKQSSSTYTPSHLYEVGPVFSQMEGGSIRVFYLF